MRVYLDGSLSTEQECFLPTLLWFEKECSEEDFEGGVTESHFCLETKSAEGLSKDKSFMTRWSGVTLRYEKDGRVREIIDPSLSVIRELLSGSRLINAEAYCDTSVVAKIMDLHLLQGDDGIRFPSTRIDEIEFVA